MPTHTPSPHRFLAPNPPSTQKSKKPHSNLRNALAIQTPTLGKKPAQKPELQFKKLTPAKRFVIAPAQHKTATDHESAKDRHEVAQEQQHQQATPRPKPPRKFERVESIEGSQELETENGDDEDDEMLFDTAARNKRRRTSPPSSPSLQDPSDPQTPAPTTTRFKVPPPRTPAPFPSITTVAATTPVLTSTSSSHRPHFILPVLPTSPPKPSRPPPDIFSPSRKTAKYTPGGMASTVTSWIVETANTAFAAHDRGGVTWGRDKEDGVKIKVRITEIARSGTRGVGDDGVACYPGGVVFARGCVQHATYNASSNADGDGDVSILVAGQGGVRGSGGVLVKIGSVLGVRVPTWDVDVQGEKWLVAVDWILL